MNPVSSREWKQTALLSLWTLLLTLPFLYKTGTNIVTLSYVDGSSRFWEGLSPYTFHHSLGDRFKYSPLFALLFGPFLMLSGKFLAMGWGTLNATVFWYGVSRWFLFSRATHWLKWLALIFCSMELDGSIRYQQVNALLIGLVLIALRDYRDRHYFRSALFLSLATNLKLLPLVFLVPMLSWRNRPFLFTVFMTSFAALLLPCLFSGYSTNILWHFEWFVLLFGDTSIRGLLDLGTVINDLGIGVPANFIRMSILGVSTVFLGLIRPWTRPQQWPTWLSLGIAAMLLANPRTESPTFVLIGPVYLFMIYYSETLTKKGRKGFVGLWLVSAFLITVSFNDLWPKQLFNPFHFKYVTKTIGVFLIWSISVAQLTLETVESVLAVSLRRSRPS